LPQGGEGGGPRGAVPAQVKHLVIGTAGHVDHGKTALIRALTGVETDRLPEEKERGISIDIGFAQFRLPSGRRAGVIDVPGHERFIKNMLAGITGIDLVLLVVAADEGVMPQTREHLDILRLLEIKTGMIVLTKKDLVDAELLELVAEDVREAVKGTFLETAPAIAVAALSGEGLDLLQAKIDDLLEQTEAKDVTALARLPIDRSFIRPGFGTVVTGTLVGGSIREGERLEIQPLGLEVRVRGLQVHGEKVSVAEAGQRVAVNLAGIERSDIRRGDVLCALGYLKPTASFAARLHLLASWEKSLKHGTRVHLHTGATEVLGRVLLLDREELKPGEAAYVQIKTEEPLVVGRGDHYIVRSYSPVHTMAGGIVIEPHAQYRRTQAEAAIRELQVKETGGTAGVLAETLARAGAPMTLADLARRTAIPPEVIQAELTGLADDIRTLEGGLLVHRRVYGAAVQAARTYLEEYARTYPLRWGAPKEEVRRRAAPAADGKGWAAMLTLAVARGDLAFGRDKVALPGRTVALNQGQQKLVDGILGAVREAGFNPPSAADLRDRFRARDTEELLLYLADAGEVVRLQEDLIIGASILDEARRRTVEHLRANGKLTVAEFRDLLGTTRKYALPLLEWMDEQKVTRRAGDERLPGAQAV
jgi:selenocysteine-specific elongation factor